MPGRHLPAPRRLLSRGFDHTPQSSGVEWVCDWRLGVVPGVAQLARIDAPRGPDQLQQVILRVATGGRGELGNKRLDCEGMRDVRHGSKPADARMRFGFRI